MKERLTAIKICLVSFAMSGK